PYTPSPLSLPAALPIYDGEPRRSGEGDGGRAEARPRDHGVRESSPRESSPRESAPRESSPRQSSPREASPRQSNPPPRSEPQAQDRKSTRLNSSHGSIS